MIPTVRIYESEERAQDAVRALVSKGFAESSVVLLAPMPGREEALVRAAVERELLPGGQARFCVQSLEEGRSVVSVRVPFGRGQRAVELLESCGPVDTEQLPAYTTRNPAPFSDLLGMPTLTHDQATWFGSLTRPNWALSSLFGLGLLSRNPAPLSSLFGMKTLSQPKRPWRTSLGLALLSSAPTPLSSLFGMKTLTKPKKNWETSFGMALLSKDPAPFSDWLGIAVLSRKDRKDGGSGKGRG